MAGGTVAVYYEAAAVIIVFVLLGQMLELRARDQAGGAIRALLNLAPKMAWRLKDGADDEQIALEQVQLGDRLRLRPGDAIPVDGTVLDGRSAVDESMVTGESVPSFKAPDDNLIGGTINGTGSLVMRADTLGAGGMLSRIVVMVADAQRSRAPIQKLADSVAGTFVPAVMGAAVAAFIAWAIWAPAPALAFALIAAVSVVIIACPCALGLATRSPRFLRRSIQIIMITGDNKTTAQAVGKQLGIDDVEADVFCRSWWPLAAALASAC